MLRRLRVVILSNARAPKGKISQPTAEWLALPQPERHSMKHMIPATLLLLTACATTQTSRPAVEIRTVQVIKEVPRPCPVTKPARPAPLSKPMPTDLARFAATVLAKLAEYAGPGGYADRADAAIDTCQKAGAN